MRRTRKSRSAGREQTVDELFGTRGLEAEPVSRGPDDQFSLRPFAAEVPPDDLVDTRPPRQESDVDRLLLRAREAAERGRTVDAAQRYREILVLDPKHVGARHGLALLLESQGELADAIAELDTALRAAPDDPLLLVARGALHGRLRQFTEAETDLRRAIKVAPRHLDAYLTLGSVLQRKGLPGEAAECLRQASELSPGSASILYYLGEALNQAGDLATARRALERSVELEPQARTFHLLGRVFDRMNRPEDAQAMYRQARGAATQ